MIEIVAVAVLLLVNVVCALPTRREANARGYDVRLFMVGALIAGPFALLAVKQAHLYAVEGDNAHDGARFPEPMALDSATDTRDDVALTADAPDPIAGYGDTVPAASPVLEAASADDSAPASEPQPAGAPEPDAQSEEDEEVATVAPEALGEAGLTLTPWTTRAGEEERPAAPLTLSELAAASKSERTLLRNQPHTEPKSDPEPESDPARPRRLARLFSRKRGGDTQPEPVPAVESEAPVEIELDDAEPPTGFTAGDCPLCQTASYADWHGLCANCAAPFPVANG